MRNKHIQHGLRVSIGMPVFNGMNYLRGALDSLLSQSFTDYELIISDNASTDGTWRILEQYSEKDQRIVIYRQCENIGASNNFKFVLEKATGRYFMWAACDDWWAPEFISAMVEQLNGAPDSSVAMSSVKRITECGDQHDVVQHVGKSDPSQMGYFRLAFELAVGRLYHLYIYGLYRTEFLKKAFINLPQVMANDRLFICQVALSTKFSYDDRILHIRTIRNEPLASRYSNEELGMIWQRPLAHWKTAFAIGPYLFKSEIIPKNRKIWIPILIGGFVFKNLYRELFSLAGRLLGNHRRKLLGQLLRQILNSKSKLAPTKR